MKTHLAGPSEQQLSDLLSEFARTMVTDFPIQAILDHLVKRIVDILPVTAAGVTLISPGSDPRYVAASDESALRFEQLQTELGEGPCLVAYETGEAVAVADLSEESRFPKFAPRALEAGLVAVFTFPLRNGEERLGALDLYRDSPGLMDTAAMEAAQTLADVAAAYLLNAEARSDLQDSTERSRESALRDALTGLPNRVLFLERLDHAVLRGSRSGKSFAVLFADLDHFKQINDSHGHASGDELLVAVAQRLSAVVRPGDTLARLSGDEFVILCEDLDGIGEVQAIGTRIRAAFAESFVLSAAEVDMTASVGIAFSGRGDQLSEELLRDADLAMYQAKRKGGGIHQILDLRERSLATQQTTLEHDLRSALHRGELRLDYQPLVETSTARIIGVEALLRWDHPSRGSVAPTLLIPLAEASGLIADIGLWTLGQACSDRRRWANNPNGLSMSINVSASQLMAPGFANAVAGVLSQAHTDASALTLEVTESVFARDSERALVVLAELKRMGMKVALDDFGSSSSSLNNLKTFPIDIVKIDQALIADMESDRASRAIVSAVIELAHVLGMKVVAEGVETAKRFEQLASLGCDFCQGYHIARPMSAGHLDALIEPSRIG